MTPDMLNAAPELLGRRARTSLSPDHVTGRSYGGDGYQDLQIQTDARQARAAYPGHGGQSITTGFRGGGASSFGGTRYPTEQTPGPFPDGIGGPGGAYGGGWADGVLTVRDRHIMTRYGTVRNPDGGGSSLPSADRSGGGRPPPRYQMVNTTESWQLGTDNTANQDNQGAHYWVDVGNTGKRFPLGTQDGTLTLVMGPPLGSYRTYGVRGPSGMHGPDPDVIDPNWVPRRGAGGAGGRGRITQQGAPGQQPADRRTVYGGVPHGLHSPTAQGRQWTMARQASIPQMVPPRVDRPNSSKVAGQSMSQGFPPEGSDTAQPTPRMPPGRMPGMASRFMGRS